MGRLVQQCASVEEAKDIKKQRKGGYIVKTFWNSVWYFANEIDGYSRQEALKTFDWKAEIIE